jgi:hypothetical protein
MARSLCSFRCTNMSADLGVTNLQGGGRGLGQERPDRPAPPARLPQLLLPGQPAGHRGPPRGGGGAAQEVRQEQAAAELHPCACEGGRLVAIKSSFSALLVVLNLVT